MGRIWQQLQGMPAPQQRDMLLELVPALIDKYGDMGSTAAADWYKQVRSKWFDDEYEPVLADPVHDDLTGMIRAKANMLFEHDGQYDPNTYLSYLNRLISRGVRGGGRSTIVSAVRRDRRGPRYARVPSGVKTCAFCAMLAGRGFVYSSAEAAGGAFNRYHAECDCEIVPSWDAGRVWKVIIQANCTPTISERGMRRAATRWTTFFTRCGSMRENTRTESVR